MKSKRLQKRFEQSIAAMSIARHEQKTKSAEFKNVIAALEAEIESMVVEIQKGCKSGRRFCKTWQTVGSRVSQKLLSKQQNQQSREVKFRTTGAAVQEGAKKKKERRENRVSTEKQFWCLKTNTITHVHTKPNPFSISTAIKA